MIRVELHERFDGQYRTVGALTVADDGTYQFDGDASAFPTDLHVLAADAAGQIRPVTFAAEPATWARNLDTVLRTGYLVPVVTHDDDPVLAS